MNSLLQGLVTQMNPSSFEHSYLADLDGDYLSYERLAYYQQEKFFTFKCPVPSLLEYFYSYTIICLNFGQAYQSQESQYFSSQKYIDRQNTLLSIDKIFNFIFSGFQQPPNVQPKSPSNKQISDMRPLPSLNLHLKSKPLLSLLFLLAFVLVMFRLTQKSAVFKQKLPKALSVFWLYNCIQLYLDLNVFQIEQKPLSKILFLELVAFDSSSVYIPEVLHLVMVIASFLYFISLVVRFNEIFGNDDIDQLTDQQQEALKHEMPSLVSQSLIQVDPLSIRSSLEFYHFVVLHVILLITLAKLVLQYQGILFLKISTQLYINTLDCLEVFPLSPRFLSLFTVSYLAYSQFTGRTPIDRAQYVFQKVVPFVIGFTHSTMLIFKRRYLFTIDDMFFCIIYVCSMCLYFTYESPQAEINSRYPWPFLGQQDSPLHTKKTLEEQLMRKNTPQQQQQLQQQNIKKNYPFLSQDVGSGISLTKEQIERRQQMIDMALRQRQEEHEEYMRKKEEIQRQKLMNMMMSEEELLESYIGNQRYNDSISADGRGEYGNEEGDQSEEIDMSEGSFIDQQILQSLQNERLNQKHSGMFLGTDGSTPTQSQQQSLDAQKVAHMRIQEMIMQQFYKLDDESKKILLKSDNVNQQEILKKMRVLASLNAAHQQSQHEFQLQLQQQQQQLKQLQQTHQAHVTQGGQGSQQNITPQATTKQTAHKAPTKAPSGRPNQRKRR